MPKLTSGSAADILYYYLGDRVEDLLEDYWSDNYPGGFEKYYEDYCNKETRSQVEQWQENSFRIVLAELAVICLERSLGRYKGREVEV